MLLAIDIGNSNIVFGAHDGKKWLYNWRIHTAHQHMADEYAVLFNQLFNEANISFQAFKQIVVSSVVPPLTSTIVEMLDKRTKASVLLVDHTTDCGLEICINPPEEIGNDIIANAVAAYHQFNSDCLIVDFGTASTIMAVQKPGRLLGGAVTAGLNTTAIALSGKTAQLPQIALTNPLSVIGNNTVKAMQSGLVLGHISMIEGLIVRMKEELNNAKVVATGGFASSISHLTDCFDRVEPLLTLNGLRLIASKNQL